MRLPADIDSGIRGTSLVGLAEIARRQGRYRDAARFWAEALEALRGQEEETWNINIVVIGVAQLAQQLGYADLDVQLVAAAAVMRRLTGLAHSPGEMAEEAKLLESARAALGEERFAASWEAGSETALGTLMNEAYEVFSRFALRPDASPAAAPG